MKNNLHTELQKSWKKAMGKPPNFEVIDKLTGGMRCCALCGVRADEIADWWLSKIDELTQENYKLAANPVGEVILNGVTYHKSATSECKYCGLLKSTVDTTGHLCITRPIGSTTSTQQHDFGSVKPLNEPEKLEAIGRDPMRGESWRRAYQAATSVAERTFKQLSTSSDVIVNKGIKEIQVDLVKVKKEIEEAYLFLKKFGVMFSGGHTLAPYTPTKKSNKSNKTKK